MQLRISQVGNGWFLSLPREVARSLGVAPGDRVEARVEGGSLIATPRVAPEYRLDDLLAGMTKDNLHQEVSTNADLGREAW